MSETRVDNENGLSRWVLVFEQPHVTWLGIAGHTVLIGQPVELHSACVLQSVDMMVPGPGGKPQQMRNSSIAPLHSFLHDVSVTVHVRAFMWMDDLHEDDRRELGRMLKMHQDQMQARRLQKLGIAT